MTKAEELHKRKPGGRVLLYMRAGEDVSIVQTILGGLAVEGVVCADVQDLCRRMAQEDVNAVLLTESASADGALPILAEALQNQPPWSDLPVLFVASGGLESPLAVQAMRELPNVLVLDRPVRIATLTSALHMALRTRARERQVRDLLGERQQTEEALEKANENLGAQADELAAVNEQLLTEREELQRQSEELHQQSLELRRLKEQAEGTARAMENLARLTEENPDPVFRVGADGGIAYRNPASFELGHRWNGDDRRRVPPAIREIVSEVYARVKVIRREMAFGERTYLVTAAPAPRGARSVNIFISDITARQQAEEALRESEQRLALALSGTQIGMYDRDVVSGEIRGTEQLARLLGLRPTTTTTTTTALSQAYHYHDWAERVHPEDWPKVEAELRRYRTAGAPYEFEYRVFWPDGSVHWIVDRGVFLLDSDGRPTHLLGIAMDITDRKRAEEALRRSEEQFQRLFEDDLTGDFISTPDGQILLCNPAFAAIFGFSRAPDAVGTNVVDLYLDPKERQPLVERLKKEGRVERMEVWRKRRDGEPIHIVENLVGHFHEQDELYEIKGYLFEDTERKRTEEQLQEAHARLNLHIDTTPLAVVEWDSDFRITRWAGEAARVFGWTSEEVLGKHIDELPWVYEEDWPGVKEIMMDMIAGRRPRNISKNRNVRKDGTVISCEWYNSAISDASGRLVSVLSQVLDVTERQQAEEKLRELNATLESRVAQRTAELRQRTRQLQQLALEMSEAEARERERLAHILHEDLQQELAAAKFHLSIARSRIKSDASAHGIIATVVEMLKDAIGKSRSLSHELSPVVLQQGDFAEALQWLASEMQAKHRMVVRVHGRAYLPSDGIKSFLFRTAQELLFNAVKHAQVQEARVRVRQCGRYICLSVSDRGRGFNPGQLQEAVGFGLLSIRERIELLGGRMKIRSAPGKGSTFFVIVPGDATAGQLMGRAPPAGEEEGRLRVLLADDHEVVRQGLIALLGEEETLEVVGEAANGREAVDLVERLRPDVVLMDVSMPVMSGEEATRRIKQDLPRTRIVSLSMREEPEVRERMHEAGADNYVLKTAPYRELLAAIRGKESDS